MAKFKLIQVSDLHFGHTANWINPVEHLGGQAKSKATHRALSKFLKDCFCNSATSVLYPSTFNADVAQALLKDLDEKSEHVDSVIVTGDLATTGDDADLSLAHDYFTGKIPAEWNPIPGCPSILQKLSLITLPGNHDRYDGVALLPMSTKFEKFFGTNWDFGKEIANSSKQYGDKVRLASLVKENTALVICLGDLCLTGAHDGNGNFGWIGQGKAHVNVVQAMVDASTAARNAAESENLKTAVIWAVHFPPFFPQLNSNLALLQEQTLVDAAHSNNISLIMTGHTHEPMQYTAQTSDRQGYVNIYCCGSTTGMSKSGNYSYKYYEIDISDQLSVAAKDFIWSSNDEQFI